MPANFNLLPDKPALTKEAQKTLRILGRLNIATFIVLIIALIAGASYIIYSTRQLNTLRQENNILKTNISNLEATEQGLVLIKDRLEKIRQILDTRKVQSLYAKQKSIVDHLPQDISFEESKIKSRSSLLSLQGTSSAGVEQLLDHLLSQSNQFSSITIEKISYNPYLGYLIDLEVY